MVEKQIRIGLFGCTAQPVICRLLREKFGPPGFDWVLFEDGQEPKCGSADLLLFLERPAVDLVESWLIQWPAAVREPLWQEKAGERERLPQDVALYPLFFSAETLDTHSGSSAIASSLRQLALRGSAQHKLQALPSVLVEWWLLLDQQDNIAWMGSAWSQKGFSPEYWLGKSPEELLQTDERYWKMSLHALRGKGKIAARNQPILLENGRILLLDWQLLSGKDAGFPQANALICATDVSVREARESAILTLQSELQSSHADLDQIAQAGAHDLREPLRNVSNFIQLLQQRFGHLLEEEGKEYADFAVAGVRRMWSLLDALMQYASLRKDAGHYRRLLLADLIHDAALRSGQTKCLKTGELPSYIVGHPGQLLLFFEQLFDNAARYNERDEPGIWVEGLEEKSAWYISVWDNGPGIEPQYFDKAIQMFRRLHREPDAGNLGMGLALCHKIALLHGGSMQLLASEGRGTVVHLRLPKPSLRST